MKTLLTTIRCGLLLLSVMILSINADATVASYTFAQSSGTYTAITGGTVVGTIATNEANFTGLPIGFTFYYNGLTRTTFSINANGYIVLGTTGNASTTVISQGGGGNNTNVVSALNYDIRAHIGAELMYLTSGSAPNRILTVQWKNYAATNDTINESLNFQIRLFETTNVIEVKYGSFTVTTNHTSQTGLKGNTNADFNNRYVELGLNTWATSIAGTSNDSACVDTSTCKPASGQTYTWTPPTPPAAPTVLTFSPVGPTSMTVNWNDNSTTETSFLVFQSTDNVTYTLAGTVPSTTGATTGTAYNYPATGLLNNTLYYFKVYAMANTPSPALSGSQSTSAGSMCGTYLVGPTGDFLSLREAVDSLIAYGLNCAVVIELQATYSSTVDTFPLVWPNVGTTAVKTLTLRPTAGATNRTIIGNDAQIFDLDGIEYFTIDGRAGGTGTTHNLQFRDSSASGSTIRFTNDAQNNTLKYLDIRGGCRGATTTGVVHFGTGTTAGGGNSNNTVMNCDFTKTDTAAQVLIYSNTGAGSNDDNTVTACTFHDWYSNSGTNYGINLGTANASWTITNNNFYMTAAQTYTSSSTHAAIAIGTGGMGGGSAGPGFTISGNNIGGSTTGAGGSAWTINGLGGQRFNGISVNVDNSSYSSVQGNTVKNIALTTYATAGGGNTTVFIGISVTAGNVNVGTINANTVGSTTSNNSIVTTCGNSGMTTTGISISSGDTVSLTGNNVGGINATDTAASVTTNLTGISASNGVFVISNNYVGSNTQANNMVNAVSTGTGNTTVSGILLGQSVTAATVTGNTVKNMANMTGGTGTNIIRGISSQGGVNTINNNIVEALTNASPQTGANGSAGVQGIYQVSGDDGQIVSGNTIRFLRNTSTSGLVQVTGIYVNSTTTGTNIIRKNRIYGLAAPLNNSVATINGIQLNGGSFSYENNMVSIGTDTSATSYTKAHIYNGILKTTNDDNKFYYNSVNVSGTGVLNDTANTFAFRRTGTGTDTLRNNIFANLRSNSSAGGTHYAIAFGDTSDEVSGKNDIYGNGTGFKTGLLDTTDLTSLFNWFTATGVDSNSVAVNPNFTTNVNLHINNASPSGIESKGYTISGITTDYDGQVRPGPAGSTNGGATAPDLGADEFDGIPVSIDMGVFALSKPAVLGCHSATDSVVITIKNYSSVTLNFAATNVGVHVSVTGPNAMTFPVVNVTSGTLVGGATRNVVIAASYNMSAAGTYVFTSYTSTTGDLSNNNDTLPAVSITVSGGTVSPSHVSTCAGVPITLTVSGNVSGGTVQWQSSPNNTTWTNVVGATTATVNVTPSATGYYRAVTCGVYNSTSDTMTVASVSVPTGVTGDTRCGSGPVTLSATSASTIAWFDSSTGGSLIDTGATFTTNVIASGNFYAASTGNVSAPKTLNTIVSGPNASTGIMFTMSALASNVTVTGFSAQNDSGVSTWAIYYRPDDYQTIPGANTSQAGWLLVDSASGVTSAGLGNLTVIPITMSILIPAGETYSFYLRTLSGPDIIYSVGTGTGDVNTSNADLAIRDGHSGGNFNAMTTPRVFNGTVNYYTSCFSNRVAAPVTVTPATAINAIAGGSFSCGGDSVHLTATSSNANYQYQWTGDNTLSDTVGNSVYAFPQVPTMYYLSGTDAGSGCNALDSVYVNVYPAPDANADANPNGACIGDTIFLDATVPLSYIFSSGNNSNQATDYPAPYGNSNFGARHQILITAEDMIAEGMVPGYLNSLTWQVTDPNVGDSLKNFTIKIGNTSVTTLTTTFETTPMTTIFTSPNYLPVNGLNTHTFSSVFYWNGTSNIIIETCFNNTAASVNARMRYMNTSYNSCTYYSSNTASNCAVATGTATATRRPYMRLGIRNQFTYLWNTIAIISSTTIANPYALPSGTAMFYVTVTDTVTGCTKIDSVSATIDPPPVVNLGADTTVCGSILLDAGNPGDNYLWNDFSNNQTLNVDTTGTYSVFVTHFGSCSSSDTINVIVLPALSVSLTLPDDSVCVQDGIQALSGGSPAGGVYGGPGVTGTNFDPAVVTPGLNIITYSVQDTTNGCVSVATDNMFVDLCNGVGTMTNDGLVNIYPNPTSGMITIDLLPIKGRCQIVLMNPESKIINRWDIDGSSTKTIDMDHLAEGIYFLSIKTEEKSYMIRMIKQN